MKRLLRKPEELALLAVKNPSGATDSEEQLRCSEEWLRHREERALRARRDGELGNAERAEFGTRDHG